MIHNQEKKVILFIGSIILIFLVIGGLIIYPQYNQIKKTNEQITDLRKQLEIRYERAKQNHKAQNNLAAAKTLTQQINSRFLKKGEEIKLVTLLENQAESLGLKQDLRLSSNYTKLPNNLSSIGLEISVFGEYQKTMEYLDWLQEQTFYLSIEQITITKSTPPSLASQLNLGSNTIASYTTFNLKIIVYVQD